MPLKTIPYPSLAMDEIVNILGTTDHGELLTIDLGKGSSSFNPFDHVEIQLSNADLKQLTPYNDIAGLESLRTEISRFYHKISLKDKLSW